MTDLGTLATMACLLEATARKPGNVFPGASFSDLSYVDLALSAAAIGPALGRAATIGTGLAILEAVQASRNVTTTNANLGIVLLLAPLAAARAPTRAAVHEVLEATTIGDAEAAYEAIRLAAPGGLGEATEEDVRGRPTVTLLGAMRLAADRDLVARQYANGFADVFDVGLKALAEGGPLETAVLRAFLRLLATLGDSLIERKLGRAASVEAARRARLALDLGTGEALRDLDDWARGLGHARNPGAVADLTAAALFLGLRDGTIPLPRPGGPIAWEGDRWTQDRDIK